VISPWRSRPSTASVGADTSYQERACALWESIEIVNATTRPRFRCNNVGELTLKFFTRHRERERTTAGWLHSDEKNSTRGQSFDRFLLEGYPTT
jgi:hypothetical protein